MLMRRTHFHALNRRLLTESGRQLADLQCDWRRRLRNALLALTQMDPAWMMWVERELPPHWLSCQPTPECERRLVLMVEAHARALLLARYNWLGHAQVGDLLFCEDWPFADNGNLTAG